MRLLCLCLVAPIAAALLVGCKPELIPGTNVEDTTENRRVIEFLGKYRKAMIDRDASAIDALCAADYFEDNGNIDQKDDYGKAQLLERFKQQFEQTEELQLEIIVQQIEEPASTSTDANKLWKVAYRYNERALVKFPVGKKWMTFTDVNRVVLREQEGGEFAIVSGL